MSGAVTSTAPLHSGVLQFTGSFYTSAYTEEKDGVAHMEIYKIVLGKSSVNKAQMQCLTRVKSFAVSCMVEFSYCRSSTEENAYDKEKVHTKKCILSSFTVLHDFEEHSCCSRPLNESGW